MRSSKTGKSHLTSSNFPHSTVSLQRCGSYEPDVLVPAISELLAPLGGMDRFVKSGQRVLLKANMIVPRSKEAAITTDPAVVRGVALEVKRVGGVPVVGDSPAFGSALMVARACGIADVAEELGMEIVDLGDRPRRCRAGEGSPFASFMCGAEALEADVIINLPKVKTHCQMGISLGIKNMFGAISGKRKTFFHFRMEDDRVAFGKLLVAILRYLKPALTIVDGIVALERDGPTRGDPRFLGILAASDDTVAVDRVLLEILGFDPAEVGYMEAARILGYGVQDLAMIRVAGESVESLRVGDYCRVAKLNPMNFTLLRVIRSLIRQVVFLLKQ